MDGDEIGGIWSPSLHINWRKLVGQVGMSDVMKEWLWILSIWLDLSQSFANSSTLLGTDWWGPFCIKLSCSSPSAHLQLHLYAILNVYTILHLSPMLHLAREPVNLLCIPSAFHLENSYHPSALTATPHNTLASPMSLSSWPLSSLEQSLFNMIVWLISVSHNRLEASQGKSAGLFAHHLMVSTCNSAWHLGRNKWKTSKILGHKC